MLPEAEVHYHCIVNNTSSNITNYLGTYVCCRQHAALREPNARYSSLNKFVNKDHVESHDGREATLLNYTHTYTTRPS